MARLSKADQVIIDQAEDLIRRIHERAGVDKSIKQVLASDSLLLGETLMIVKLFVELDHLKIDNPMLNSFITESLD